MIQPARLFKIFIDVSLVVQRKCIPLHLLNGEGEIALPRGQDTLRPCLPFRSASFDGAQFDVGIKCEFECASDCKISMGLMRSISSLTD